MMDATPMQQLSRFTTGKLLARMLEDNLKPLQNDCSMAIDRVPEAPRVMITLPIWHYRYLLKWAFAKKQSKAGMIQNVVQARIEANQAPIDEMIAGIAEASGMTAEELEQEIYREDAKPTGRKGSDRP